MSERPTPKTCGLCKGNGLVRDYDEEQSKFVRCYVCDGTGFARYITGGFYA